MTGAAVLMSIGFLPSVVVAGATSDGICVVYVWQSRGDFDRFMQEQLGEQLGRAGVPQPQIVEFAVHASEQRG
jgi:hypothetical protein